MPGVRVWLAFGVALLALSACALPPVEDLPERGEIVGEARQELESDKTPPVVEVPVARGMLVARSLREPLPGSLASRRINVSFPAGENTLERLMAMVNFTGVRVATRVEGGDGARFNQRSLPFQSFNGSYADLAAVLETGAGIVAWWQNGTLFLSDRDRFAFTVPQNQAVIDSVMSDLKSLGATDITQSLRGGQIIFSASPGAYNEVIRPYVERIHRNMAMVRVQVAVVGVQLTDQSASGFDWNAFSLQFSQGGSSVSTSGSTPAATPTVSARLAQTGKLLGLSGTFNVNAAISFLSKFGETNTRQNVEVHTLSGALVTLRSGETIPYVSGVGVNAIGSGAANNPGTTLSPGVIGSAQTSSVQTGLTIKLTPFFDADNRIVTVDMNVLLNNLLEFRDLSAGSQLGTLTQPVTQEQSLNDIVRVVAGNTVVLGGLQTENNAFSGNDPTMLRTGGGTSPSGGKRSQDVRKEALFIILRPTVTVFREGAAG
jgi:hypothetical protein